MTRTSLDVIGRHPAVVAAWAASLPSSFAAVDEKGFVIVMPNEIKYEKNPAGSGPDLAVIAGDPTKEGFYIIRARFAPGVMSQPHSHPGDRHVTVISGHLVGRQGIDLRPEQHDAARSRQLHAAPRRRGALRRRQGRRGDRRDQGNGTRTVNSVRALAQAPKDSFDDETKRARLARAGGRQRAAASPLVLDRAARPSPGSRCMSARAAPPDMPPWMKTPGMPMRAYGERSPHEAGVQRHRRCASRARRAAAARARRSRASKASSRRARCTSSATTAACPISIPTQHQVLIHGLVERPLIFSMDALARYPLVSRIQFLECSGNSGGKQQRRSAAANGRRPARLVSCSEWTRRAAGDPARRSRRQSRRHAGCSPKAPTRPA